MRIIAGKHSGYILKQPMLEPTRPTTDIAKEALFSSIDNYFNFDNIRFLDLFGGTGNISYEFASRGCEDITTVEIFPKAINFIKNTSEKLQLKGHTILQMDVFQYINSCSDFTILVLPHPLSPAINIPLLIFGSV